MAIPGRPLPTALRRAAQADRSVAPLPATATSDDRLAADQARKKPLFDAALARWLAAGASEATARARAHREVPFYFG